MATKVKSLLSEVAGTLITIITLGTFLLAQNNKLNKIENASEIYRLEEKKHNTDLKNRLDGISDSLYIYVNEQKRIKVESSVTTKVIRESDPTLGSKIDYLINAVNEIKEEDHEKKNLKTQSMAQSSQ